MSTFEPSMFRAYDLRGTYPDQFNEEVAYAVGQAFVSVTGAKKIVVGRDVRSSGVSLQKALIEGATDAGADVLEVGCISTEMLYFAAGYLDCDGGMTITASHNPAQWNGVKFIGKGAMPMTKEGELGKVYDFANSGKKIMAEAKGSVSEHDLLTDYITYLKKFIPTDLPDLKIVANTNFGANGKIVDLAIAGLPLELVRLNWNEDGTFPKGSPDPLLPKNRTETIETVEKEQPNFAVAWDADADRAFFYDEKGRFFHGYYITALLIKHFLSLEPGQNVVCERRLVWANLDAAHEGGGEVIYSRTGHGYIKKCMRDNNAIMGGESSGHYYFRDFYYADNGLITFLTITKVFGDHIKGGGTVSDLLDYYLENYPIDLQEENYITPKAAEIIEAVSKKYEDGIQNHEDGLTIDFPEWHLNLRSSSNEPVLRLNLEAASTDELKERQTEVMNYIASFGAELRQD